LTLCRFRRGFGGQITRKRVFEVLAVVPFATLASLPNRSRLHAWRQQIREQPRHRGCRDLFPVFAPLGPRPVIQLDELFDDLQLNKVSSRISLNMSRMSDSSLILVVSFSAVPSPDTSNAAALARCGHSPPARSAIAMQNSQASAARSLRPF